MTPPRAVLVVKLSAIGDVAQSLFALPALRQAFPDARLGWVVGRGPHELLEGHPLLEHLHIFERGRWGGWTGALRHAGELRAFLRDLRVPGYDLALDLQGLARSALMTLGSGAPRRLGLARSRELARLAYTERVDTGLAPRHAVERYRELLARAGAVWDPRAGPDARGLAPESPREAERAERLLATAPGAPRVALLPSARWPSKRWGTARFRQLADRLRRAGLGVVVLGGGGDRSDAAEVAAGSPGVVNLAGEVTLRELVAVLRRVDLLVTCDTGPMHLSAALGTPTLALFGPTDPRLTGPHGSGHRVLRAPCECAGCRQRICPRDAHACMQRIGVDQVIEAALSFIALGRTTG